MTNKLKLTRNILFKEPFLLLKEKFYLPSQPLLKLQLYSNRIQNPLKWQFISDIHSLPLIIFKSDTKWQFISDIHILYENSDYIQIHQIDILNRIFAIFRVWSRFRKVFIICYKQQHVVWPQVMVVSVRVFCAYIYIAILY